MNLVQAPKKLTTFKLKEHTAANLFKGSAPKVQWLVERILPTAKLILVASPPGVGKSYLALNLAVAVSLPATNSDPKFCFGGKVVSQGKAVIISAEDDHAELHRRLEKIGRGMPHDLHVYSMPDFGHFSIMKADLNHEYREHPDWTSLKQQIIELGNVKLIVFDTLQSMTVGDLNAAEVAQYVMNELAELANSTGATVIAIHHLKKSNTQEKKDVLSAYAAMESIRGSGAITGAARAAYCLYPHPNGLKICETLGIPYEENKVVYGLVAKSNGDARRDYTIYIRNDAGLLVDETMKINTASRGDYALLLDELLSEIEKAHEENNGYSASLNSSGGLHKRREEMPPQFHAVSLRTFENMVDELLVTGKIEKKRITNGYKLVSKTLPEASANAQCVNAQEDVVAFKH